MYDQSNDSYKRHKPETLYDRLQKLKKRNAFNVRKITQEGYGSYFKNPEEVNNLMRLGHVLKGKGEAKRNVDALKWFTKAFVCYLKVHIIYKNSKRDHFKTLVALHKQAMYYADKFNKKIVRDVLCYSMFIVFQDIVISAGPNMSKDHHSFNHVDFGELRSQIQTMSHLYKVVKDKGFKIVTLDKLEAELVKILPDYFTN